MTIPRTRQDLYDRIRASSKDELILDEMVALGFWERDTRLEDDPTEDIRRLGELERELAAMKTEAARLRNHDKLIKAARKARLMASREKQKATKDRRAAERVARAGAWQAKQAGAIGYLGEGFSGGLNHTECNAARLAQHGLPELGDAAAIATAMGIPMTSLRFLAFARRVSRTTHYVRFRIPKKAGGDRVISAPMPRLKAAQHWILHEILDKVAVHDAAHGFRLGRSIVGNATPHVGARVVINMDLKDFFPSIAYPRVKGVFRALGYSECAATILAMITTEPEIVPVALDGVTYHVATGPRHLPQGAPTSPAVTNILCRRLDKRLTGLARQHGFTYTRYADDLTFSGADDASKTIGTVLKDARSIVAHEQLTVHPAKTRVLRRGSRQEVTGLTVNQKLSVPRATLHRVRAVLFQVEKDGPAGKKWGASPDVFASMRGFALFVRMVDRAKGEVLVARVNRLIAKHAWKPAPRRFARKVVPVAGAPQPSVAPAADDASEQWW